MRRRRMTILAALFSITIVCATTAQPTSKVKIFDPLAVGPYPVGVTTTVFVDHSRTDTFTKAPRTLVTEIWYPATDDARNLPKNKFSNFIPGGVSPQFDSMLKIAFKKSVAEFDELFWNYAVRDARVRDGKFPLIIFSHGNRGSRWQNTFWYDYLASHGYVIVSADHTANAIATIIEGTPIFFQEKERANSATDRPKDMSFLLDEMTRWNGGADSRFAGKLDLTNPVASGMSFGSYSAIRVADVDQRFKVVIGMSAAPPDHQNLTVPSLYMLGTEDRTIGTKGNELIRANYAKHTGPSFLLEMKNGGHYSFTDIFKINKNFGDGVGQGKRHDTGEVFNYTPMEKTYQIINAYSVAFLGYFVKGQTEYLPFMLKNHWPDELIWDVKGIDQKQATNK